MIIPILSLISISNIKESGFCFYGTAILNIDYGDNKIADRHGRFMKKLAKERIIEVPMVRRYL